MRLGNPLHLTWGAVSTMSGPGAPLTAGIGILLSAEMTPTRTLTEDDIQRAHQRGADYGLRKGRSQGRVFERLLASGDRVVEIVRRHCDPVCAVHLNEDGSISVIDGVVDTTTKERLETDLWGIAGQRVVIRDGSDPATGNGRVLTD